jgi:protein SCO1/2
MRSTARLLVLLGLVLLAACGGGGSAAPDFTLRDDAGNAWTRSAQGKAMVLLFGFTHCMDTCPATLAKLERLTQALGAQAGAVDVVFVTIDPQRDSGPVLRRFLSNFAQPGSARLVGLTGSTAQIEQVERAYHVWAQKIPGKRGSPDYDEAHTSVLFLIDARGRMRGMRDDDESPQSLAKAIREMLE